MSADYYKTFGYERPLFGLAHDNMFRGPLAGFLERTVIRATPDHAAEALAAGGMVLVFPWR